MKKHVALEFPGLSESIQIELDDSDSPATVRAIIGSLPISMTIERWGDELYSEPTPVRAGEVKLLLPKGRFLHKFSRSASLY